MLFGIILAILVSLFLIYQVWSLVVAIKKNKQARKNSIVNQNLDQSPAMVDDKKSNKEEQ